MIQTCQSELTVTVVHYSRASRLCAPPSRSAGTPTQRPVSQPSVLPSASMTWSTWTSCRTALTQRRRSPKKFLWWMRSSCSTENTAPSRVARAFTTKPLENRLLVLQRRKLGNHAEKCYHGAAYIKCQSQLKNKQGDGIIKLFNQILFALYKHLCTANYVYSVSFKTQFR